MLRRMVMFNQKKKTGTVPVYLNVYDLTTINGYAYWVGLGIYHSGVQVHGVEYGFGAHDHPTTGIFEVEPKQCPGFMFRKSILIGRTDLGPKEVRVFMEKLAQEFPGNTYHLITKNCNHFCNDVCLKLTGKKIPRWVNRLARIDDSRRGILVVSKGNGQAAVKVAKYQILLVCIIHPNACPQKPYAIRLLSTLPYLIRQTRHKFNVGVASEKLSGFLCNCVLPVELNQTKIRQVRSDDIVQEKKKLRSRSTRFTSSSNPVTSPSLTPCPSSSGSRSGRQRRFIPLTSRSFVHDDSTSSSWSLKA